HGVEDGQWLQVVINGGRPEVAVVVDARERPTGGATSETSVLHVKVRVEPGADLEKVRQVAAPGWFVRYGKGLGLRPPSEEEDQTGRVKAVIGTALRRSAREAGDFLKAFGSGAQAVRPGMLVMEFAGERAGSVFRVAA